jgi:hypothetical protein
VCVHTLIVEFVIKLVFFIVYIILFLSHFYSFDIFVLIFIKFGSAAFSIAL